VTSRLGKGKQRNIFLRCTVPHRASFETFNFECRKSKERNTKKANSNGTPVLLVDHCHSQQTHPLGSEATKSRRTKYKHEQAHKHLCLYLTGDYPEPGVLRYTRSPRLNWNLPPSCKHKEERPIHSACICSVRTVHGR
jgi:hypothetical protein